MDGTLAHLIILFYAPVNFLTFALMVWSMPVSCTALTKCQKAHNLTATLTSFAPQLV